MTATFTEPLDAATVGTGTFELRTSDGAIVPATVSYDGTTRTATLDPVALLDAMEVVIKSTHLGDNRTLALPAAQTIFWEMGAEMRQSMEIADTLIRVSVGIEAIDDLLADFGQAFARLATR